MILSQLKKLREDAGLTQAELAGAKGVECTARTIHTYERGGKVLARRAKAIAKALKVKLEELQ